MNRNMTPGRPTKKTSLHLYPVVYYRLSELSLATDRPLSFHVVEAIRFFTRAPVYEWRDTLQSTAKKIRDISAKVVRVERRALQEACLRAAEYRMQRRPWLNAAILLYCLTSLDILETLTGE